MCPFSCAEVVTLFPCSASLPSPSNTKAHRGDPLSSGRGYPLRLVCQRARSTYGVRRDTGTQHDAGTIGPTPAARVRAALARATRRCHDRIQYVRRDRSARTGAAWPRAPSHSTGDRSRARPRQHRAGRRRSDRCGRWKNAGTRDGRTVGRRGAHGMTPARGLVTSCSASLQRPAAAPRRGRMTRPLTVLVFVEPASSSKVFRVNGRGTTDPTPRGRTRSRRHR
jgi:hypothetical protein